MQFVLCVKRQSFESTKQLVCQLVKMIIFIFWFLFVFGFEQQIFIFMVLFKQFREYISKLFSNIKYDVTSSEKSKNIKLLQLCKCSFGAILNPEYAYSEKRKQYCCKQEIILQYFRSLFNLWKLFWYNFLFGGTRVLFNQREVSLLM